MLVTGKGRWETPCVGDVGWRLLGEVGFTLDGSRAALSGQRVRAVAAYLVLHRGERISNQALVDALWGEHPPKTARNSVQRFVADLRRALGGESDRLTTADGQYLLCLADGDSVDAVELADAVDSARGLLERGRPVEALDLITAGLDQMVGQTLDGIGDTEYGSAARHRLDDIAVDALEVRLKAQLDLGHCAAVAAEARALTDRYPYRELLWAHLITGLYGSGRQREALQAYDEVRARLVDDLGVDPSPALQALQVRVLAQDPRLLSAATPAAGIEPVPPAGGRLQVPATRFFGRERELALLQSLLTQEEGGFVTIVGPGGSGKTRLASRIVSRVEGRFDDVATVELDGVGDPTRVTPTIAATCGLYGAPDPSTALVDHFTGRRSLLVLDNAEGLLDAVAALAVRLMGAAPQLHVLVTSREAIGISAEQRVDLTGLDLEAPLLREHAPAVALFIERARRQVRWFEPDEHVDRICRLVGGLPLAIELAARWTTTMTAAQIAERLSDDVGLLVTDAPDVPERQRTMAGVLDAAWSRLGSAQAELAAGLSIFIGGFDLTAAHDVCGASPLDLQRLVAQSMLSWLPGGRLEMHELIRQHAASRLDPTIRHDLVTAHRDHYLGRLRDGYETFVGPDPAALIASLDADFDNIVAAWNAAIEAGDEDARSAMLGACATLAEFASATGHGVEVADLFDRAVSVGSDLFVATMHGGHIRVSWYRDTPERSTELYHRAASLLPGSTPDEAACRVQLVDDYCRSRTENTGEREQTLELVARTRPDADLLQVVHGHRRHHAVLDMTVARLAISSGDFDAALGLYDRAIDVFDQIGDALRSSDCVAMLAAAHAEQYHIWEALQADLRALDLRRRRSDQRAIALTLINTGASYVLVGAWDDSERLTLQAIDMMSKFSEAGLLAYLDCQLAEIRVGQERRAEAEQLFVRGIDRLRQLDYRLGLRLKLPEWARFLVDEQRWLEAELVIDEARLVWEQVGGNHFLVLLDGLAARVAVGRGNAVQASSLADSTAKVVCAMNGTGHPSPIRTLADVIDVLERCETGGDQIAEIRSSAADMVKRVVAGITDPTYRRTYLALPEVADVMS